MKRSIANHCLAVSKAVRPFKFVASDMDGTLLSPQHRLDAYTQETLRRVTQDAGIPFIFATGRLHADVAQINANLQTFFRERRDQLPPASRYRMQPPSYLITSNGALIHNAETGEVVVERVLPPQIVRELYELLPASENRINTNLCQNDVWYARMDWQEMMQFHKESGVGYTVLEQLPGRSSNETGEGAPYRPVTEGGLTRVNKMFFASWDKPLLERLEKTLLDRYKEDITVNFSAYYCLDITPKGVTKASALRALYELLPQQPHETDVNVDRRMRDTIAFGDDINDAAMLSSVGKGYVMGNGNPRLKELYPQLEVIGTNKDGSVPRKLRELLQLD